MKTDLVEIIENLKMLEIFLQSLHWRRHSLVFQALIFIFNSAKLIACLIAGGGVIQANYLQRKKFTISLRKN